MVLWLFAFLLAALVAVVLDDNVGGTFARALGSAVSVATFASFMYHIRQRRRLLKRDS